MVISSFANEKSRKGFFLKFGFIGLAYSDVFWCLCFMFIAANIVCCRLIHQDAQVPTVSSINSLLSQYCKASHYCFGNFYVGGGAPTVRFAPVVPWAKTGPAYEFVKLYSPVNWKC
jgi:hypothetical protein